ncbi:hypothetical protein FQR65_LT09004 [Abscondita terminalis]|nr:hypothetical protein FQR65_LT09004 [Abscondita terminalis]
MILSLENVIIYNIDNCPICLNTLKSPVVAACGHSYCIECLLDYVIFSSYDTVLCPMCRRSIERLIPHCFQELRDLIRQRKEKNELWKWVFKTNRKLIQKRFQNWKKLTMTIVLIAIGVYYIFP